MNREEYMQVLDKKLRKMSKEDREEALSYYNEYFDEAGVENESIIIKELGLPAKLAAQIRGELALKALTVEDMEKTEKKQKKSIIAIILLAIFAVPIALPLTLAFAILVLAVVLTIIMLLVSFGLAAVVCIIISVIGIIAGLIILFQSPITTVFFIGYSLALLGLGLLIGIGTYVLTQKTIKGLKCFAAYLLERTGKK